MLASTTQETSPDSNDDSQKKLLENETFLRSISTLEPEEFYTFIQKEYGACWGTLKFEDSISDYTNEVNLIDLC
jgi:hypothetical protein